jgi:hypothetical protein
MHITNFLNKENVNTLWDVISDEDLFKSLHRDAQSQILHVFSSNIKGFFENEKTKTNNLIEINKKYMVLILNYIKNNFSRQAHNKIRIYEETPVKELITYEEIQNDRQSQFEKDLGKLQEEFTNSMTLPVPEVPKFADNYKDAPISEMDKMIKEMTAKRNYDVEQINRNNQEFINLANGNNTNNWLTPQETSIKTDKFTSQIIEETPQNNKKLKYLNIEQPPDIPKKNVTWGENTNYHTKDELEENIFKKLKKVGLEKNDEKNDSYIYNATNTVKITAEDRITHLENGLAVLNNKMDLLIDLLKQNK